jgi:hypothetical protein
VRELAGPTLFDAALVALLRQTLFLDLRRRARRYSTFRNMQGVLQEMLEALDDLGAIAMLAAGSLRTEVEDPTGIDIRLELGEDPAPLNLGQAWGILHVEGQLDLRGGPIDVLAPRAPAAAEVEMELRARDFKRFSDAQGGVVRHRALTSEVEVAPYSVASVVASQLAFSGFLKYDERNNDQCPAPEPMADCC